MPGIVSRVSFGSITLAGDSVEIFANARRNEMILL